MNRAYQAHRHIINGLLLFLIGAGLFLNVLGIVQTGTTLLFIGLALIAMVMGSVRMYEGYHETTTMLSKEKDHAPRTTYRSAEGASKPAARTTRRRPQRRTPSKRVAKKEKE